ncbi:MAG: hypothetical protein SGI84_12575 [Gemmatimonadota bacterium]|nr:hypothetical protein [Gemmatimonadota bacterium]
MGNSVLSGWRQQLALLILSAILAGCGSVATDGLPSGTASLAVVPEYPANFEAGALNLVIDRVRLRVVRPPSEWIADTSATFPADAQSVTMRLSLPLKARQEQLGVVLELWAGPLLIFSGARTLEVTEGTPIGDPPRILLTYRGPGAEARSIRITPRDTVLRPGQQFQFGVAADNGAGQPVGDVYVNWSLAGAGATVTPGGLLSAPGQRGSILLRAAAATGARDSTRIWFAPPPTVVLPLTGAGQVGVAGAALPAPLVARVMANDGLGVPGIPVQFYSAAPGATIGSATVITDADGIARSNVGLGTVAGGQGFVAYVSGVGAAQFGATATVGAPSLIVIVRGNNQVAAPGSQLPVPLEIAVRDQFGNTVRNALVRWSVVQGGGELGLTETLTDGSGVALSAYRMGPTSGTNVVRATLDLTGNSVLFVLQTP